MGLGDQKGNVVVDDLASSIVASRCIIIVNAREGMGTGTGEITGAVVGVDGDGSAHGHDGHSSPHQTEDRGAYSCSRP